MIRPARFMTPLMSVALFAASAAAQVDYRVNQGNQLGDGRALDNNPGLGAGGRNAFAPRFDYGYGANSIVTGNVTGLSGFRGYSPIVDGNRFRDSMPSAGLSGYFAKSISVSELQQNVPPAPTFYFGRQETIANLGQIRSGLNAPGSSMLLSPFTTPQPLSGGVAPFTAPTIRSPNDLRLSPGLADSQFGVRQVELPTGTAKDPLRVTDFSLQSVAESSIFGVPEPGVRPPATGRTLLPAGDSGRPLPPGRNALEDAAFRGKHGAAASEAGSSAAQTEPSVAESQFGVRQGGGGPPTANPVEFGVRQVGPSSSTATEAREEPIPRHLRPDLNLSPGQTPSDLGDDRFADMFRAVRASQQAGVRDLSFQVDSGVKPDGRPGALAELDEITAEQATPPARDATSSLRRRSDQAVAQLATAARWAQDVLESPVVSFVGRNRSRFNERLAAAEEALHAGQYYRAADLFSMARTMNEDDPLPLLGRGHALIAAGDYRSAVWCLQQGISRFPQIAAFRLDLISLIGREDVFDIRRADLEAKLAIADHFELRFILGYLEFYSGLPEEGLRNLQQAAKAAPPESVISIFPELLIGQRELPAAEADGG